MKKLFIIVFLVICLTKAFCSSWEGSIKSEYTSHSVIFYGEFIDCYELENAFDINGFPIIIQNYRVLKRVKGFNTYFGDSTLGDTISIQHQTLWLDSSYCNNQKGKKFLIYASTKNISGTSTFPYFKPQNSSREIIDENFTVTESSLKDEVGKNELELLLKYEQQNTLINENHDSNINSQVKCYETPLNQKSEIEEKNKLILIISVVGTSIILLLIILLLKKSYQGSKYP